MINFYEEVKERFLRYVKINTQSVNNSKETPTSKCQFDLARLLCEECKSLNFKDVYLDRKNCIVYAKVEGNIKGAIKTAIIAHMDTSPDVKGENVKPWVFKNYDGSSVVLNKEKNIILDTKTFPNILKYKGDDIVFTDGTTLLGGDDKAAIAIIMAACNYLNSHKEIPHGDIMIAFTPDEEVGGLAKDLDFKRLNADIAYTVDGDYVGYYSDETFNASEAVFAIKGKNVHPGTAKGKMKNAVKIANDIINMIPPERPENTEGREGYYHPHYLFASVEEAKLYCLVRDHSEEEFEKRENTLIRINEKINEIYGEETSSITFQNRYKSMKNEVDKHPFMIDELKKAIKEIGIEPVSLAFRGGTDGSKISERGLACPNISAGYENGHSRYEFVPIQSMEKIANILVNLFINLGKYDKDGKKDE